MVGFQSGRKRKNMSTKINLFSHEKKKKKKKKKKRSSICSHTATITAMFWEGRGGQVEGGQMERYNKEEPEHGVVRWTLENALTHCSDNNIFSARA